MAVKVLHNGKAIIIRLDKVDRELLDTLPNLQVIGAPTTGLDHLPWDEINKRGIKVISLQGEREFLNDITSTAEHTLGLMIALLRNYKPVLKTSYLYLERDNYIGHRLSGKTLGLIGGEGRVGKQMAKIAEVLGMKVLSFDKFNTFITLEELLNHSDIVSLHIPLEKNEGFFTKEMFTQMRPNAYLINTSRDKIIEKGALKWALENRKIAGAAIDFVDDPELIKYAMTHDNLILTPHLGGATHEDLKLTEEFIVQKVESYLDNIKYHIKK